jgi:hypothetical protein
MLPPSPGAGAPHEAGFAPADGVTVTELIVKMLSMVIVKTTLLAAVDELFPTVQVRMPVPPGLTVEGVALPETETGIRVVGGGGGSEGWVVRNALLNVKELPLASNPVTTAVSVMAAPFICATTLMLSTCPGAMLATLQMAWVTPAPTGEQVPASGWIEMMNAPSTLLRMLFTETFWIGNSDAFVTTIP